MKAKIAVLASGSGSNFEALVDASKNGRLAAEVVGVISNRPGVQVLERAERLGVASAVITRVEYESVEMWNLAMAERLSKWQADWVALAGFSGLIGSSIIAQFPNRIVNSHPSLLPRHGGKGMFGNRVHASVLGAGDKETGITVHFINERFDEGPIIAQTKIPVEPGDTAETLAERVKAKEHQFYPAVLHELLTGRIKPR